MSVRKLLSATFTVGALGFGGGAALIPIMEREFVQHHKLADDKAFTDQSQISGYAQAAVSQMARAGILGGYADGTFRPKNSANRAEAAKILAGIFEIMVEGSIQ